MYRWEYESFVDVVERIPEFIEQVYNKKRVHSGIQYLPPEEFEAIIHSKYIPNRHPFPNPPLNPVWDALPVVL